MSDVGRRTAACILCCTAYVIELSLSLHHIHTTWVVAVNFCASLESNEALSPLLSSSMKRVIPSRIFFQLNLRRPLYTQGCGVFGALGHDDDFADSSSFKRLAYLDDAEDAVDVKHISAGWGHSSVVTSSGNLIIFGRPYDGQVIKTISRMRSISPAVARFYGIFNARITFKKMMFDYFLCKTFP